MIRTLLVCFFALYGLAAQAEHTVVTVVQPAAVAGPTWIINEDAEGTGTPSGWTDGNTPDWDYTTTVLAGSQSLFLSSGGTSNSYYTIVDADTRYVVIKFQIADATPTSVKTICAFRTSANGAVCMARLNTAGTIGIYTNGADGTATTDALSNATPYYIKLVWVDSGTCTLEFNTSLSFSGTGTKYTTATGGTTTDCTRFVVGASTSGVQSAIIDTIRLDDVDITGP